MDKTSLVKVCKTYCNKDRRNDYSSRLSVIGQLKLHIKVWATYGRKASSLFWCQDLVPYFDEPVGRVKIQTRSREFIITNRLFTESDRYPYSQYNTSELLRREVDEN